jgi:hypothetical protein
MQVLAEPAYRPPLPLRTAQGTDRRVRDSLAHRSVSLLIRYRDVNPLCGFLIFQGDAVGGDQGGYDGGVRPGGLIEDVELLVLLLLYDTVRLTQKSAAPYTRARDHAFATR